MGCGCNKKRKIATNTRNLTTTRGLKIKKDTQVEPTLEILENFYNKRNDFVKVRMKNSPTKQYVQSPTTKLHGLGYMFYGKFKTGDVFYMLEEDFNETIEKINILEEVE